MGNQKEAIMAAVRVRRGQPRKSVRNTLKCLGLDSINSCIVCSEAERGMLDKAKDYVTYGEINVNLLSDLLTVSRQEVETEPDEAAKELIESKKELKGDLKGPYKLSPPSKGYKKIKTPYKRGGSLGYRGEAINQLLMRMV